MRDMCCKIQSQRNFCGTFEVIFCNVQEKLERYSTVLRNTKSLNSLFTVQYFRVL